jgi:hypothetical protein
MSEITTHDLENDLYIPCDICRGSRMIRLPVYHQLIFRTPDTIPAPAESSREYPCPACGESVPVSTLTSARLVSHVASDWMRAAIRGKEIHGWKRVAILAFIWPLLFPPMALAGCAVKLFSGRWPAWFDMVPRERKDHDHQSAPPK